MAGGYPVGEEIAGYLIDKFFRFGPPLLLKLIFNSCKNKVVE
jgi:hypothetical protein